MTHGKAIRTGLLAVAFWAPVVAVSYAQSAASPEPDLAANVSHLLEWVDEGLDHAAEASHTDLPPPPALGEGPVGQAIEWLFGGGEAQSASTEAGGAPVPRAKTAPVAVETPAATPVATTMAEIMDPPEDDPLVLTAQPRPVATVRPQGLLLPVAAPQGLR